MKERPKLTRETPNGVFTSGVGAKFFLGADAARLAQSAACVSFAAGL